MCSIGAIHHPPIEVSVFLHSFKIKEVNKMAVFSENKPLQIYVIEMKTDEKRGKLIVKYAFRYNISQTTKEETFTNEQGQEQTRQIEGWEYEEYITTQEFDMFLKTVLENTLKAMYLQIVPQLEALSSFKPNANDWPKEFDVEEGE